MSLTPYQFPMTKGLDRSVTPMRADPASFYDLLNFRQSPNRLGELEQTPYFYQNTQYARGTYYDGGSLTEPVSSAIRLHETSLVMTDYVFRNAGVVGGQVQALYQTAYPVTEGVTKGCWISVNSLTGLALTLGNGLDIVIDGAATFKWRKNGGIYTAGVPITTAGVSIDGGNVIVYFLAATGFTVNDTWTWQRTDSSYTPNGAGADSLACQADFCYYKNQLYFLNIDGRAMTYYLPAGDGGATSVVVTIGYRPVWGSYLAFFQDHMIIGAFSKTAAVSTAASRKLTMGWSDVTDINNFIPTDTNEADSKTLPDCVLVTPTYIRGIAILQQQLFVFTTQEIFVTSYLGLPDVFSFQKFSDYGLTSTGGFNSDAIVRADEKVYIIGSSDIIRFAGGGLEKIGNSIRNIFATSSFTNADFTSMFGFYDQSKDELLLVGGKYIYVFQERYGTWYRRSADFSNTATPITFIGTFNSGYLNIGLASRTSLFEDYDFTHQPVFDAAVGASYTTPLITTQLIGGDYRSVKEINDTVVLPRVDTASATYYSTAANAQVKLYWHKSADGTIGTMSTNTDATWVSSKSDGMISYPHDSFRLISLQLQLVGLTNGKPAGRVTICAIEPMVKDTTKKDPSR